MRTVSRSPFPNPNPKPNIYPKRVRVSPYVWMLALGAVGALALIAMCLFAVMLGIGGLYASGKILPNVTVQGNNMKALSVGSMTPDDAAAKLNAIVPNQKITLRDEGRSWDVSAADLGIAVDGPATANKAAQVGRQDSTVFDGISTMFNGAQVTPIYPIDLAKAADKLNSMSQTMAVQPTNTTTGRKLNVDASLDAFPPDLTTLLQIGEVKLVMDLIEGPRTKYTVSRGEELGLISKKFNVPIADIVTLNHLPNAEAIDPGQVLIIPAAGAYVPSENEAPQAPTTSGKDIVVSLLNQRIYAYQDGNLIHTTMMSSGREGHDTVGGDYHIYVKYASTRMTGPDYDIPNVPWTMYFYQGYGIHGAFWHDNFGRTMSHGCVNLETSEAKWFYDWAPIGTLVRVLRNWSPPV